MIEETAAGTSFDLDPARSIGYLLRDTSRRMLRLLQQFLEPHGVTLGQYFLLRELWINEGSTQRELSARINVLEPSTVAALDAMEKRDLVVRVRSKQDRRKINVYLTAKGRGLRSVLLRGADTVNRRALSGVGFEEVEQLRSILRTVKANLDESDGGT